MTAFPAKTVLAVLPKRDVISFKGAWPFLHAEVAMNLDPENLDVPPLGVEEGSVKADDAAFVRKCLSLVEGLFAKENWQLRQTSLTRSRKWGLVWRADIAMPFQDSWRLCARVVCWEWTDGVPIPMTVFRYGLTPLPSDE